MIHLEPDKKEQLAYSASDYRKALHRFDVSLCEATAVSQAQAGRYVSAHLGYATHIFARMCAHAQAMIRAVPHSRWVEADFWNWDFGAAAGHARAIFEGHLLFSYLIAAPNSEAEMKSRIEVMHLNDCTRRIELHKDIEAPQEEIDKFEKQREEVRERLKRNTYFQFLPAQIQKGCLSGKYLMIKSRDEMAKQVYGDKATFDAIFDLLSQHTHILPLSFYRMEPQGRGSGIENETDRAYTGKALAFCANIIREATDKIVEAFPDTSEVRQGIKSTFSPGPRENLPRPSKKKKKVEKSEAPKQKLLAGSLNSIFKNPI